MTAPLFGCARPERGFSLIEVLVTMIVIALGLLGFAGLQAHSLKSNRTAMERSVATVMASDILDRMRANRTDMAGYNLPVADTPTAGTVSGDDLVAWRDRLSTGLPDGTGGIAVAQVNVGTATFFDVTVTIQWSENADGSETRSWTTRSRI